MIKTSKDFRIRIINEIFDIKKLFENVKNSINEMLEANEKEWEVQSIISNQAGIYTHKEFAEKFEFDELYKEDEDEDYWFEEIEREMEAIAETLSEELDKLDKNAELYEYVLYFDTSDGVILKVGITVLSQGEK
jgi:hypothetical protein